MTATIILVRHALSLGNLKRSFQGQIDAELAPEGIEQLRALTARFEDIHFDAIYSSPLRRAMATANACNSRMNLPIHTDPRLIEIGGGVLEGLTWEEMHASYPQQAKYWVERSWRFSPEGGESMTQVRQRAVEAIRDIAAANEGKTVVVVTHGCTLRNLMTWAKGLTVEQLADMPRWSNTGVGVIEMNDGIPTLIAENEHSHLEAFA